MVTKPCPKCKQHLPVACKACPCGHVFFVARRPISIHKVGLRNGEEEGEIKRRRTERTKRERPDYFNSLQIDNELKRLKSLHKTRQRTENSTSSSTNEIEGEGSNSEEGSNQNPAQNASGGSRKRGRPKKSFSKALKDDGKTSEKEEDMFANMSKEKELQFTIILAEINRKMCAQQFKV